MKSAAGVGDHSVDGVKSSAVYDAGASFQLDKQATVIQTFEAVLFWELVALIRLTRGVVVVPRHSR